MNMHGTIDGFELPWTPSRIEALKVMYLSGASYKDIGADLGTSPGSARHQIRKLGLRRERDDVWDQSEVDTLKIRFLEGVDFRSIGKEIGRSRDATKRKAFDLGMHRVDQRTLTWTEERLSVLAAMWNAGDYCSEIAQALGVTRNAVIGKVDRLGLRTRSGEERSKAVRVRAAARPRPITNPAGRNQFSPGWSGPKLVKARPPRLTCDLFDAAIPRQQLKPLWEIGRDECHWPIGNPGEDGFGFCCAATAGQTYCAEHTYFAHARVREKPTQKAKLSFGNMHYAAA
jgi:GcrA cell cycle regulator